MSELGCGGQLVLNYRHQLLMPKVADKPRTVPFVHASSGGSFAVESSSGSLTNMICQIVTQSSNAVLLFFFSLEVACSNVCADMFFHLVFIPHQRKYGYFSINIIRTVQ